MTPSSVRLNRWMVWGGLGIILLLGILVPGVMKMVVLSLLLAYIFDPIVTAIELRGFTRTVSTLFFFAVVISILVILVSFLAPVVVTQLRALQEGAASEETAGIILRMQAFLRSELGFLGLRDLDLAARINELSASLSGWIMNYIVHEGLSLIVFSVAVPFIVFFLLKDGREMKKSFISIVPNRYFEFALDLVYKMDVQLGNYLRSQFIDALTFGVLATIALWLLDVKYFMFIGAFAGAANLVPYVGPIAGALPAVAVSLFSTGDAMKAVQVIAAFTCLKLLDDVVIQPLLVARGVNLHPLLVLLAIIVGGELFGILGMLLAVPATGFSKVVLQESIVTLKKYRLTD
ncbi:MAG: AI-2E family transporter [Bacteroidota bacterium]